jgi:SpoVK/Ycf46/Vps4 family AAA+-type ATPase
MIRPGRFDDVVHCGLPDRQAFEHLLRIMLVRQVDGEEVSLLADDVDFDEAWIGQPIDAEGNPVKGVDPISYFEGFSFAFISGAVENILRSAALDLGADGDIGEIKVTTRDLQIAAMSKRAHHAMMDLTPTAEIPTLDAVFRSLLSDNVDLDVDLDEFRDMVDGIIEHRMHGSRITLETETGKEITGRLATN